MQDKKINIEVKKINNKSKDIEWTETLEIPYDVENKKAIEKENKNSDHAITIKTENDKEIKRENSLLNTTVLQMELNPFHQPSMNTKEFNFNDSSLVVKLSKTNNENITNEDELLVLEKLLEKKIITPEEFKKKKELISLHQK